MELRGETSSQVSSLKNSNFHQLPNEGFRIVCNDNLFWEQIVLSPMSKITSLCVTKTRERVLQTLIALPLIPPVAGVLTVRHVCTGKLISKAMCDNDGSAPVTAMCFCPENNETYTAVRGKKIYLWSAFEAVSKRLSSACNDCSVASMSTD